MVALEEKENRVTDNATHTQGPWLQSSTVLVCDQEARVIANCTPLVDVPVLAIPINQVDANARLIAAAPELLDCLEELVNLIEAMKDGDYKPDSFTTQPARNAIYKATGKEHERQ